ncbi:lysylphosphatidylglycerol synthase domain-containing protein [Devosia sp. CN2-171]|uniref:lysylphosphatidylglycerol synthase domain-containing protein n=1 Tax=Devosia sp. CN2-171 TaxID=3400909 RepID=UPI003BF8E377
MTGPADGAPARAEASGDAPPHFSQRIIHYLGLAAFVLSGLFFVAALAMHWSAIGPLIADSRLLALLCVLAAFGQLGFILAAAAFHRLLKGMGEPSHFGSALSILMVSQFTKYLPGNVVHHAGRLVMSRNAGLSPAPVGVAILIELAGSALAATLVAIAFASIRSSELPELYGLVHFSPAAALLPAILLGAIAVAIAFAAWKWPDYLRALTAPRAADLVVAFGCYLLNVALMGAIFTAIAHQVAPHAEADYFFLTAAVATAWTLGLITPGAPGGLGVREAVLLALVAPVTGTEAALLAALGLRIATTLTDAIGFGLGLCLRRLVRA